MLAEVGHEGRRFTPSARRAAGAEARAHLPRWHAGSSDPFVPYTLSAFELRRALALARASGEAFSLTYVRLPGTAGDEAWRASSSGVRVHLAEDGRGGRRCVLPSGSLFGDPSCEPSEIAMLPPPKLGGPLGGLMAFLPQPILPGLDEPLCVE